ncbi:unnamed protein product [Gadus morhua 'NCC']
MITMEMVERETAVPGCCVAAETEPPGLQASRIGTHAFRIDATLAPSEVDLSQKKEARHDQQQQRLCGQLFPTAPLFENANAAAVELSADPGEILDFLLL